MKKIHKLKWKIGTPKKSIITNLNRVFRAVSRLFKLDIKTVNDIEAVM